MTTNAFHIDSKVCYETTCNVVELKWVRDFDGTGNDAYGLIMLAFPVGGNPAGIYVKDVNRQWKLVMRYEDASEVFSTATHSLKVILHNRSASALGDGFIVFRNGKRLPTPTLELSDTDVWAVCESIETSASGVTKENNAASQGILQISAGPDKSIEDFIPGTGGIVSIDPAGKASVMEVIELRSGGGLLIGGIVAPSSLP